MKLQFNSLLKKGWPLLLGVLLVIAACNGEDSDTNGGGVTVPPQNNSYFTIVGQVAPVPIGDSVFLEVGFRQEPATQTTFTLNGQPVEARMISAGSGRYFVPTSGGKIGTNAFSAISTFPDGKQETISINVLIKSDLAPQKLDYQVLQEFEHDPTYYTQGLVYEEGGWIYEGTGLNGESKLACYNLYTRELKHELEMPNDIFGEGITVFDGKIYQITYQSGKVFVYDKETFAKVRDFGWYSEGWGLTTDGKELILSDGTSTLYFLDPATFTETRKMEVADHKGAVKKINELEYVDGMIWANIWQTDRIIVIDPESGKVVQEADMSNLLPDFNSSRQQDLVLNGIAYKAETNSFVITGKKWPRMYDIAFGPAN